MKTLFTIVLVFLFQCLLAQGDLVFYADREKVGIENFINKKETDTFELMYFVEGIFQFEYKKFIGELNAFYETNKAKLEQPNKKKAFKFLHASIQKQFLKKYTDSAQLSILAKTGEFNCLIGSMVYGYFLKKMNIPFSIVDIPGHVYLKTNYQGVEFNFETTNPNEKGVYTITAKQKEEAVIELLKMKLISAEDIEKKGYERCYQEFFYDTGVLNFASLVGMAYYNSALFAINNLQYERAVEQFEKSKIFYKSKTTDYWQSQAIGEYFKNLENKKDYRPEILANIIKKNKYLRPAWIEEAFAI